MLAVSLNENSPVAVTQRRPGFHSIFWPPRMNGIFESTLPYAKVGIPDRSGRLLSQSEAALWTGRRTGDRLDSEKTAF
jgi:hypothetical protein